MAIARQKITLDVYKEEYYKYVNAKQDDNISRLLIITLTANDERLKLDSDQEQAYFRAVKPDGYDIINPATINKDGDIEVALTDQVLACPGKVEADVAVSDGENVLASATFFIQVEPIPRSGKSIVSTNEFLVLVEATERAEAAARAANKAKEDADAAETLRQQAEDLRQQAEETREQMANEIAEAENSRESAETARADAERLRTEAEDHRATAEVARQQAEDERAETFAAAVESVNNAVSDAAEATQKAEEAAGEADASAGRANAASEAAEGAAQKALAAAELPYHPPQVMDGEHYWSFWDAARGEYVQSDLPAGVWITGVRAVTGEPGTEASVVNEGTAMEQQLVFTIPRGQDADIKTWAVSVPAEGWTPGEDTYGTITGRFCAQVPLDGLSEDPKDLRIEYAGGDMTAYCTMDYWRSAAGELTLWAVTAPGADFEIKIVEVM